MIKFKTLSKLAVATAIVLLSAIPAARAVMADGTYTTNAGAYTPLWDISGDYETNTTDFGTYEFELTQEPNGDVTGDGTDVVDGVAADLTVSGSVGGTGEKPTASMKLDVSASDFEYDGVYFDSYTEDATVEFSFDVADRVLSGDGSVSVKAKYVNPDTDKTETYSKTKSFKDEDLPLLSTTTGDWTLTLNLTPASGTKYTGTASITTSAGHVLDFTVTGTYTDKTGVSDLTLKGDAGTLTLDITTFGDLVTIESISGKVSGQTLSYKQPKD